MIPYGNVDTELGGQGQAFPPNLQAGNAQSDTANVNYALGYTRPYQPTSQPDPMAFYFQLGQQLMQQQQAMMQQLQRSQPQGGMVGSAPAADSFDLGANSILTGSFDPNWLTQRLAAGSANGASIQSGGGGSPGGSSKPKRAPGDADHLPDAPSGTGFGNTPSTNMGFLGGWERLTN